MRILTVATAVGAGTVGGVFFAFSTFVMSGLRQAPPRAGLEAMQGINRAAPTPMFMIALLGTAAACVGLGAWAVTDLGADGAPLRVAGCGVYLVTIIVTIAYHIPRNNALDGVDPAGAEAAARWVAYAGPWTGWNHVRTVAGIGAAVLLTLGSRA